MNLYEILGVKKDASEDDLRHAYRRLAHTHHPDVCPDPKAHELMAKINAAFEILIDPIRRMEYDTKLNGGVVNDPHMTRKQSSKHLFVNTILAFRDQEHKTPIYSLSFIPETHQFASVSFDNELLYWDYEESKLISRQKLEGGAVNIIHLVNESRLVAAGCSENTVSFWNVDKGHSQCIRFNAQDWVCHVSVSPDGSHLAYGTVNNKLAVHSTKGGEAIFTKDIGQSSITTSCWDPTGTLLATGGGDAIVRIWRISDGEEIFSIPNLRSTVTAIAFSPNRDMIAIAAVDLSIRVFSLKNPGIMKVFFGHHRPIESMAFHPTGKMLASVGRDGCVGLWNVAEGLGHSKIEASHQALNTIAFSSDGQLMAAGGLDKVLRVWTIELTR